ncbi:hypothetical protein LTR56_013129 [Elasticomyces elasticus]|nr:hypothetical protein LTR56_013129 [Elasticomyces elasticus]KAK3656695.1 hypothetical protein LTR22_009674 [Elasticomyces elasticus]KAK4921567.1 hypothetical protein LTR49_011037 [Elasticomyces elasticus]KAK5760255.1 hypothetical protein LTS12_009639 [Elasticomyces elasticus]
MATPSPPAEREYDQQQANGAGDDNNGDGNDGGVGAEAPPQPEALSLLFEDMSGTSLTFKLKKHTRLGKAMDAFSERVTRDRATLRFLFDGERVLDDSTPESMGLEDNDKIEVHAEQIGGGEASQ